MIGSVFEKIDVAKIKGKANDFPTEPSGDYIIPLLTAGIENQGLARYAKKSDCPTILSNVLSVSANGANSGTVFYHPEAFAVLQDAYAVRVKGTEIPTAEAGLFLASALNKAVASTHDWTFKAGWNRIKNDMVSLPFRTEYVPDFEALTAIIHEGGVLDMSKIDTSSWKEFRIGDLFTSENGNTDIQKEHINGEGIDVVSSGVQGNGYIGKSNIDARIHSANTITVDMFGNVFYRDKPYKMVTHARVFALVPNGFELNEKTGLFICTSLKWLPSKYDYGNMCSFEKIKDSTIFLPATEHNIPDWHYMQERIAELEQERIAELEQYLIATGLSDYELTDEDIEALSISLVPGITKNQIAKMLLGFAAKSSR